MANRNQKISLENVDYVNSKVLVEAANMSITYKAENILDSKNVLIIPDLIGNSG